MASSPLQQQVEYTSNQSAQAEFQAQYNLEDPSGAIGAYMKSLHQYTKSQLDSINRSPSRPTDASAISQTATLTSETSVGSMSSTAS
ncbi:MAG: hypothetical protein Q9166_004499 [cf. Caloplaca sp. 2 TL-2023]